MSELTPDQIFNQYQNGDKDIATSQNYLKTIIEDSSRKKERLKALNILGQINDLGKDWFLFLENLQVSDASEKVRAKALELIVCTYFDLKKAKKAIEWSIENERSGLTMVALIKAIYKTKSEKNLSKLDKTIVIKYSEAAEKKIRYLIKMDKNVDMLWKLYKGLESDNSIKKLTQLKEQMERAIGKKYIQKYQILPREAMALGLLERELGEELLDKDEYPGSSENYAKFIARLFLEVDTTWKHEIHVIDVRIHNIKCRKIKFLELLPRLKHLSIYSSELEKLKGLESLKELEELYLTSNPIKNIEGLTELKKLKKVCVGITAISRLDGIEALKNLTEIEMEESLIPESEQERIDTIVRSKRNKIL